MYVLCVFSFFSVAALLPGFEGRSGGSFLHASKFQVCAFSLFIFVPLLVLKRSCFVCYSMS